MFNQNSLIRSSTRGLDELTLAVFIHHWSGSKLDSQLPLETMVIPSSQKIFCPLSSGAHAFLSHSHCGRSSGEQVWSFSPVHWCHCVTCSSKWCLFWLANREIGPRSRVWSEKEFVDKAAFEFSEVRHSRAAGFNGTCSTEETLMRQDSES